MGIMRIIHRLIYEIFRIVAKWALWSADYTIKQAMKELNPALRKRFGNRSWNEYIDRQNKRTYQRGTRMGKKAVKRFLRGLTIRCNGDVINKAQFNDGIVQKYAICQFHFYKWIAEMPEFEPDANELINVPVMTFFKTEKGNFRYLANTTGSTAFRHTRNLRQLRDAAGYLKAMRHKHLKQRVKGSLN